jgi:hypothetical protein
MPAQLYWPEEVDSGSLRQGRQVLDGREHYPEFAARWDERVGRAGTQLPGLLNAVAVASLSPDPAGLRRLGPADGATAGGGRPSSRTTRPRS